MSYKIWGLPIKKAKIFISGLEKANLADHAANMESN